MLSIHICVPLLLFDTLDAQALSLHCLSKSLFQMKYIRRCPIRRELKLKRCKMGDIMRQNRNHKVEEDGEWQERKWKKLTFLIHLHYIFCNTWYKRDDGKRRSACWTLLSIGGRSPPQSSTSDSLGLFFPCLLANYWKNKGWTKWREDKSMKLKATEELLIYIIGQQGLLHKSTAWGFVFTTFSHLQVR